MIGESHGENGEGGAERCALPSVCLREDVLGRIAELPDTPTFQDIAQWRKAERERLIAARLAVPVAERQEHGARVARDLDALIPRTAGTIVGLYWPFRGEPDLRAWMTTAVAAGLRVALPVVVAKGQPLAFREWQPGARLEKGVWNIPYPADGAAVVPTAVIAPLVGFDAAGYRLGYGGGFFDRTLAALAPRPLAIGVGHPVLSLPTIHPQRHDIPMDWIVTGDGAPRPSPSGRPR